jgi:peptidyl-prolyl cis-trans isomerase C
MWLRLGNSAGASRRAWRAAAATALALAVASAGASAQSVADALKADAGKGDPVVARVNRSEIHRSDMLQALGGMPSQVQQMPIAQVYPLLLERLIDSKLVVGAGRAERLQDDAEIKRKVAEYENRAIQETYLSRAIGAKLTDDALRKKYDAFVKENPPQEEVHARHILVPTEQAAQEVLAELRKGADFAAIARAKSTDGSARDGGDLGYFSRGDMVAEFSDAAFAMKPGEVVQAPVKSQFGWHIIKVEDRRMSPAPSFEDTKEQLKAELSREMVGEVVETLRTKAKIERFDLDGKPLAAKPAK